MQRKTSKRGQSRTANPPIDVYIPYFLLTSFFFWYDVMVRAPTVVLNRAPTYANPAPEGRVWSQPMLPLILPAFRAGLCGRPTRSRNTHNSKSRDRERVHWNVNTGNVHATELLSIEFSGARSAMARSGYWTYLGKYTCARKINNQPVVRKHFSLPAFLGSTP